MSSKLTDIIIPAFTALSFTIQSQAVQAYTKLGTLDDAYLPCRVITPYNGRGVGRLVRFTTLAGNRVIDWQVSDLLLIRKTGGVELIDDLLQGYQEDYEATIHTLRATQWTLIQCEMTPDVFEYPEGSGRSYDGVRCVSTVRELR